jgi:hypothetical protein
MVGPRFDVDLVKQMQPSGDLSDMWIMFDHIKSVKHWTTMACHIYDSAYCLVMVVIVSAIIGCCYSKYALEELECRYGKARCP